MQSRTRPTFCVCCASSSAPKAAPDYAPACPNDHTLCIERKYGAAEFDLPCSMSQASALPWLLFLGIMDKP